MERIELTRAQEEIVFGSIMGDCTITNHNLPNRKNSRLEIEHSTKQQAYCEWKASILGMTVYYRDRYDARTGNTSHMVSSYSSANPYWTDLYDEVYVDGHKRLCKRILDGIGPLGLAIWYMDDGSLTERRMCILHTDRYTLDEQQIIQQWFIEKFGLHPRIKEKPSNGKMRYKLIFDAVDSNRFREIVRPYIVPELMYKITPLPYKRTPAWYLKLNPDYKPGEAVL